MVEKKKEEEHKIIAQYKEAYKISEDYTSQLSANLLNKGLVGKEMDKGTIDTIVDFFHSSDVVKAIKDALGARAAEVSDKELLARYAIPRHAIEEELNKYESVTPEVLLSLVQQLSATIHAELTKGQPAEIANIASKDGVPVAQGIMKDLYKVSGGDQYLDNNARTIENLVTPEKMQAHTEGLYSRRELQTEMSRHSDKIRKAIYTDDKKKKAKYVPTEHRAGA